MKTVIVISIVLAFSATLLLGIMAKSQDNPTNIPTSDFVSASLTDQLQRSGIRMEYRMEHSDLGQSPLRTYIRSNRIQYHRLGSEQIAVWSVFDRQDKIGRSLTYSTDKNIYLGSVDNRKDDNLNRASLPDPILYNLRGGDLLEMIGSGKVHGTPENIDGHDCWRIDIEDTQRNSTYTVWVDSTIAFTPRKIVSNSPNQQCTTAVFRDYKELKGGVWYPMNMRWEVVGYTKTTAKATISVDVVTIDTIDPLTYVSPEFPSGTKVADLVRGAEYTVP